MKRGANVALTQEIPGLTGLVLGVSWNAGAETRRSRTTWSFAAILCGADGRARRRPDFVFFNQLSSPGAVGAAAGAALGGDQEQIEVDLAAVPRRGRPDRGRALHQRGPGAAAHARSAALAASIRVLDARDNQELVRSEELAPALHDRDRGGARRAVPAPAATGSSRCSVRATRRASPASPPTTGCRCDPSDDPATAPAAPRPDLPAPPLEAETARAAPAAEFVTGHATRRTITTRPRARAARRPRRPRPAAPPSASPARCPSSSRWISPGRRHQRRPAAPAPATGHIAGRGPRHRRRPRPAPTRSRPRPPRGRPSRRRRAGPPRRGCTATRGSAPVSSNC